MFEIDAPSFEVFICKMIFCKEKEDNEDDELAGPAECGAEALHDVLQGKKGKIVTACEIKFCSFLWEIPVLVLKMVRSGISLLQRWRFSGSRFQSSTYLLAGSFEWTWIEFSLLWIFLRCISWMDGWEQWYQDMLEWSVNCAFNQFVTFCVEPGFSVLRWVVLLIRASFIKTFGSVFSSRYMELIISSCSPFSFKKATRSEWVGFFGNGAWLSYMDDQMQYYCTP